MAKQTEGFLGGFNGKLGPVVGYRWKGLWCMRSQSRFVKNPRTEAQQAHRALFKAEVQLAGRMRWAVNIGLKLPADDMNMTALNLFVKANQQAFSDVDGALKVDYAALQVSGGPVAPVALTEASVDGDNVLNVKFEKNPLRRSCSMYDNVYFWIYSEELEQGYLAITEEFKAPDYITAVVHGKQTPENKAFDMNLFVTGKADILVATSVIEVGVDVPNASVMVIESAERFGLAQLHQLRGRVGRGAEKSYCILMTGYKLSKESRDRIDMMCATNDGFELAEADLKMRGPGDFEGTRQSGLALDLHIADLAKDSPMLEDARNAAIDILDDDPSLSKAQNALLAKNLQNIRTEVTDYSKIS